MALDVQLELTAMTMINPKQQIVQAENLDQLEVLGVEEVEVVA